MIDKMKNIYTILDEINYKDDCERAKLLIKSGVFMPEQFIYSIIQKFYDNVLEHVDTVVQQRLSDSEAKASTSKSPKGDF